MFSERNLGQQSIRDDKLDNLIKSQQAAALEAKHERDFDRACADRKRLSMVNKSNIRTTVVGVDSASSQVAKHTSMPRTPGKTLEGKQKATLDIQPGELPFEDGDMEKVAVMMENMKALAGILKHGGNEGGGDDFAGNGTEDLAYGGKKAGEKKKSGGVLERKVDGAEMFAVNSLVSQVAGVKNARASGQTCGITKWKNEGTPADGFRVLGLAAGVETEAFNPDHVFFTEEHIGDNKFVHRFQAVVDAKREGKKFDNDGKGKIVSDAGYVGRISNRQSVPVILWRLSCVLIGEVFVGEAEDDDVVVFFGGEWNPSEDEYSMMRFLRVLHHAARFGTLFPVAGESGYKYLGRGRTSIVFQLVRPLKTTKSGRVWNVVKYVIGSDHKELATHEVAQNQLIHKAIDTQGNAPAQRHFFYSGLYTSSVSGTYTIVLLDKVGEPLQHTALGNVDLVQQALNALDQMHAAGVVHNDIRLSNCYMVGDTLVLGDLGYSLAVGKETTWRGGSLMTAHSDVRAAACSKELYKPSVQHDLFSIVALCRLALIPREWAALERLAKCQALWRYKPSQYCDVVAAFWSWQFHLKAWGMCAVAKETNDLRRLLPNALSVRPVVSASGLSEKDIEMLTEQFTMVRY